EVGDSRRWWQGDSALRFRRPSCRRAADDRADVRTNERWDSGACRRRPRAKNRSRGRPPVAEPARRDVRGTVRLLIVLRLRSFILALLGYHSEVWQGLRLQLPPRFARLQAVAFHPHFSPAEASVVAGTS